MYPFSCASTSHELFCSSTSQTPMAATAQPATVLNELRRAQRADGPAAVLAIGTAVPANCVRQDEFTDWYFRVTKSDHLTELKAKMKRMCTDFIIQFD